MKTRLGIALLLASLLSVAGWPLGAHAHGVEIDYTSSISIEIVAKYDSGEPMADAQVVVYAPDDPGTPRLTGICDAEGRFVFTPDDSIAGTWDVQVRKAGHGDMIHIPIGAGTAASDCDSGLTTLQIVVMAVAVVWGSVGTALFFRRRRA